MSRIPVFVLALVAGLLAVAEEPSPSPLVETIPEVPSEMPWQVPDLPSADMRLSWTDFRELLHLLQPPPQAPGQEEEPPPWPWSVASAHYEVDATRNDSVHCKAVFDIEVWQKGWSTIPLLGDTVALHRVRLDGEVSRLQRDGSWLSLLIGEPGLYQLEVEFYVEPKESDGDVAVVFPATVAGVTELRVKLGSDAADLSAPGAARISSETVGDGRVVEIALRPSETVDLHWRRPSQIAKKSPPPPPRVSAHINTQMHLSTALLEGVATVTFDVLRGSVAEFILLLPENMVLLNATGQGMEWSVEKADLGQRMRIVLNHGVSGSYPVEIRYEYPVAKDLQGLTLPKIVAQDVARQDGAIGLSSLRNMSVELSDPTTGVVRIDPEGVFQHGLDWQVNHAFRYHQPDYALSVAVEVIAPQLVGSLDHLVRVSSTVMAVDTTVHFRVLRGETNHFSLTMPTSFDLLGVEGAGMDWYAVESDEGRRIEIDLNEAVDEAYTFRIVTEQNIRPEESTVVVPSFVLHDVVRQSGWVGVATLGNVKVDGGDGMSGIQRVDEVELPPTLRKAAQSPILHAFQYQEPFYELSLAVQKLDDVAVRVAAIDTVEMTSVLAEEMLITRARYRVRNNQRQFLRIDPGPDVEIWGATVDGHVVSPAKDPESEHGVLLRMRKSQEGNAGLGSFPMELIYMRRLPEAGWLGQRIALETPVTDVLADRVEWTVYLPESLHLMGSEGDLDVAALRATFDTPDRGAMTVGERASIYRLREGIERFLITDINNPAGSAMAQSKSFSQETYPATAGTGASTRLAGVLPVHINLPQSGVPYFFERVLVPQGESLHLNLRLRRHMDDRTQGMVMVALAFLAGMIFVYVRRQWPAAGTSYGGWAQRCVPLIAILAGGWLSGWSGMFFVGVAFVVGAAVAGPLLQKLSAMRQGPDGGAAP